MVQFWVAWKPESLSLDTWALYLLCAQGLTRRNGTTRASLADDKSVTGNNTFPSQYT
jgi:hypothetical protein